MKYRAKMRNKKRGLCPGAEINGPAINNKAGESGFIYLAVLCVPRRYKTPLQTHFSEFFPS